ncbi:RDD family protein [Rheinheimera baltica]|uniref:RDD family protein n=1 Tax=Rheinheimera baltica TaxID=67576 RepID=UPI0004173399|nr:RDD family protein [Rheinheimera baltica]
MSDGITTPIKHSTHLTEIAPDTFVDATGHQLTPKEVRNIVTPHDFAVNTSLFGLTLARPWRRALAISIDGVFIALLAGGGVTFFTPLYLYLVWRCHALQNIKRRNILLLLMPLMLVFAYTENNNVDEDTVMDIASAIELSTAAIAIGNNCDEKCADTKANELISALQNEQLSNSQAEETLTDLLANSVLSAEQQQQKLTLLQQLRATLSDARQLLVQQAPSETSAAPAKLNWWQKLQQSDHSVMKWAQGILADLGISFGWAVAYLTVFTSWNNGQTPGKKLLGIKVVQLDNKPLSLWGAFGRQGGYSAGLATGLLGFFQIYWDPNRQAIQDKLADTLVLRIKN